jgi:cytochrome c biogenesis protein CcmG/thiol:disulfide interchange protein DsbE
MNAAPRPAPGFTLPDQHNQSVSLSDWVGQPVLLAFWATWCGPCKAELPLIARLQKELPERHVTVLAIAEDSPEAVHKYLNRASIELRTLIDPDHTVARSYGECGMPSTILIDRDGEVVKVYHGRLREDEIREVLAELAPRNPQDQLP